MIDGLIALFNDELYVVRPNGLVINVDYTAWGWTQLLLGILLIAAGYAEFLGPGLGRTLGVTAERFSAIDKPSPRSRSTVTAASR